MLVLSAIVYSCKKDDKKSTSDLIQGKWNVTSVYEHYYDNGFDSRDTTVYSGTRSETIEFANNGKVYYAGSNGNGSSYRDTGVYKLDGSNLIFDATDTFKINSISAADLQLYSKDVYSSNEYEETTINLKK